MALAEKSVTGKRFSYEKKNGSIFWLKKEGIADHKQQISVQASQIAKEQQEMIEAEVNDLEETYPALLQNQSETSTSLFI